MEERTLAILLGSQKGIIALAIAFAVSYLWIVILVVIGSISPWTLVVFLTVKKPILAIQGFLKGDTEPQYLRVAMKSTASDQYSCLDSYYSVRVITELPIVNDKRFCSKPISSIYHWAASLLTEKFISPSHLFCLCISLSYHIYPDGLNL